MIVIQQRIRPRSGRILLPQGLSAEGKAYRKKGSRMRYEKGHKDATRAHIIDVASRQFRGHGVAAVGLAGIMSDAGLTNGAFYNHFESKEDLVQAVLANALDRREQRLRAIAAEDAGLQA